MADTRKASGLEMQARTASDTCVRCRQKFEPGHRVLMSWIVDSTGAHPTNLQARGSYLHEEFELTQTDCRDPYLREDPRSK